MIYPSKKKILIISSIILVCGGLFLGLRYNSVKTKELNLKVKNQTTVADLVDRDTDGDGLKDWEEVLTKTDPNKADTDGNGVSDFKQIRGNSTETKTLTQTEKFNQDLLATLVSLDRAGALNETSIANISQELADKIKNESLPDKFSKGDLKIVPSTNKNAVSYAKKILSILSDKSQKKLGSELSLTADYLSGKIDKNKFQGELKIISDSYKKLGVSASVLEVPENAKDIHYLFINNSYNTGVSLELLIQLKDDPLNGVIGIENYRNFSSRFLVSLEEIAKYFQSNAIIKE